MIRYDYLLYINDILYKECLFSIDPCIHVKIQFVWQQKYLTLFQKVFFLKEYGTMKLFHVFWMTTNADGHSQIYALRFYFRWPKWIIFSLSFLLIYYSKVSNGKVKSCQVLSNIKTRNTKIPLINSSSPMRHDYNVEFIMKFIKFIVDKKKNVYVRWYIYIYGKRWKWKCIWSINKRNWYMWTLTSASSNGIRDSLT
jgi:hypothetical protein